MGLPSDSGLTSDLGTPTSDLEQLPASTYTPIELELLDRQQIDKWLDSISERLERIKGELMNLEASKPGEEG